MFRHWKVATAVAAIMVGLVMLGVGLATAEPSAGADDTGSGSYPCSAC